MALPGALAASLDIEAKDFLSKDAITLRNQIESPLLRLPGEIRNQIWECTFTIDYIPFFSGSNHLSLYTIQKRAGSSKYGAFASLLHITKTSRQVYAETNTLVFGLNVVRVSVLDLRVAVLMLPEKVRETVQTVKILYPRTASLTKPSLPIVIHAREKLPALKKIIVSNADVKAVLEEHVGADVTVVVATPRIKLSA